MKFYFDITRPLDVYAFGGRAERITRYWYATFEAAHYARTQFVEAGSAPTICTAVSDDVPSPGVQPVADGARAA